MAWRATPTGTAHWFGLGKLRGLCGVAYDVLLARPMRRDYRKCKTCKKLLSSTRNESDE